MQSKFMFYENFLRAIEYLPEADQAKACLALCRFGITGALPDDPVLKMFCVGVSASVQKYQGRGGKRDGAGRKPQKSKEFLTIEDNQKNQKNQNNQKNQKTQTETINININSKHKTETETEITGGLFCKEDNFKESSSLQDEIEKSFEKFWAVYPKQRAGNKHKAFLAYKKAIKEKRSTPDKINSAAGVYAKSEQVLKGFAKGAAAWLNDDRFNNEEYQKRDYSIPVSVVKEKPVIISEEEKLKDQQDFNDLVGRIKEFSDEV